MAQVTPREPTMDMLSVVQRFELPFAQLLGIRFLSVTPERITAEMVVRDELCTRPVALHRGRRTMVWQTRVSAAEGRLLAVVIQTQLVLEPSRTAPFQVASLFAGKSAAEQKALLVALVRDCAAIARELAA